MLSLALAGAWTLFLEEEQGRFWGDALISHSGIAAAWCLYRRLGDQGMRFSLDAERYELHDGPDHLPLRTPRSKLRIENVPR